MDPLVYALVVGAVLGWLARGARPSEADDLRTWIEGKRAVLQTLQAKNKVLHRRLRIDHDAKQRLNNQLNGRPFNLGRPDDPVNLVADLQGTIAGLLEETGKLLDGQDVGQ